MMHVPSEVIAAFDPHWGASLLGDKAHSMIFDNSKIKRLVPGFCCSMPFSLGVREIPAWFNADPSRKIVDESFNRTCDAIIAAQRGAWAR